MKEIGMERFLLYAQGCESFKRICALWMEDPDNRNERINPERHTMISALARLPKGSHERDDLLKKLRIVNEEDAAGMHVEWSGDPDTPYCRCQYFVIGEDTKGMYLECSAGLDRRGSAYPKMCEDRA